MTINTPEWAKHAVFYQIFPDRFARSPRTEHPPLVKFKPWGSPPSEQGFQGGDLRGIVDKLDYLRELGVTALYLNPIFSSAANHRYHTFDYYRVDPLLGGDEALRELLDAAHARDMRVVLDGVFNHASRGFWQFHHILENGPNSPYIDWFIIDDWPLRPYSSSKQQPHNYAAWYDLPALPKLNTDNPDVRAFIMDIARYWLDFGIDGWRLDVPAEIDDDSFWQEFRQVCKAANPEAYLCGELWEESQRWLQGDQFDAVMNYIFTWVSISFFGAKTLHPTYKNPHLKLKPLDAPAFGKALDHMHGLYDWEINQVQLNLIDSHDMPRALWIMQGDKSALRLCVLLQMTMPGAPCIYYGDEIGMSAGHDPDCREAFPWEDQSQWDAELLDFYRRATTLRHAHRVLRTGSYAALYAEGQVFAFRRQREGENAIVVFNAGQSAQTIVLDWPQSQTFGQACPPQSSAELVAQGGTLRLDVPARDALVLVGKQAI